MADSRTARPETAAGLLASVSWADLLPYMREQRQACLDFAAEWRTRGTPAALHLAEYNETRAATLTGAIEHAGQRTRLAGS